MWIAILAMTARILLLGYERIVFKQAGEKQNSLISTFWLFFLASIFQIPLLFVYEWTLVDILKAAPSAAIYTITFTLYVYSLTHYDVSLVTPFYNFNVLFLLVLSIVFLDETFSWVKLLGIGLLFYGTTYLNKQQRLLDSLKAVYNNRGCLLMILASLLMAIGRILDRRMIENTAPAVYSFALYFLVGCYLAIIIGFQNRFSELWIAFRSQPKPFLLGAAANAYSYLFLLIAFLQIEVSIAEPLSMLSVIISIILSYFIFHEQIKDRLIGTLFMVAGAVLLIIQI